MAATLAILTNYRISGDNYVSGFVYICLRLLDAVGVSQQHGWAMHKEWPRVKIDLWLNYSSRTCQL